MSSIKTLTMDRKIGAIVDPNGLQSIVSVRGDVLILQFAKGTRRIEIAFAPTQASALAEMIQAGVKLLPDSKLPTGTRIQ